MQVIETYPKILSTFLMMENCNGGINRSRTAEQAARETDAIIGADGVDHADLVAINEWLGTLNEDDLLTFVDGEEEDIQAITDRGGQIGALAHTLFNELFDGADTDVTLKYRITATVMLNSDKFETEPVIGDSVENAKMALMEWITDIGWEFIRWNDVFELEETPLGFGCVTLKVRQIELDK